MSASAGTIYMCYGSIRGEAEVPPGVSRLPASGGWMKLTSCSLTAAINYATQSSVQLQSSADAPPALVTKLSDASSTGLFRESLLGTSSQPVVIIFVRTGTDGPQEYMRFELEECGIMDFAVESGADERATEKFAITFNRLTVISWDYNSRGEAMGQAMATIQHVH